MMEPLNDREKVEIFQQMFRELPIDTLIEVQINNEERWIEGYLECGTAQQIDRHDQEYPAIILKSPTYPTVEMWIPLVDISGFKINNI